MKTGKTLAQLAAELDRQNTMKKDFIVDTHQIQMSGNGQIGFPINNHREELTVRPVAHQQLATHLGIPSKYYDRLLTEMPDLLAANVNRILHHQEAKPRMVRTLDGGMRAFLSNRYRRIENFDLAQVILPIIGEMDNCTIESCEVTERRMYLKVINHSLRGEVKVGDVIEAGFMVANSEIGLGAVDISPFVIRLVCMNGAKINELGNKRRHVGRFIEGEDDGARELYADDTIQADDRAFMLRVRDQVRASVDESKFQVVVRKMREAMEQKIEGDPIKAVEVAARQLTLNEGEKSGVLRFLIEGGDLSRYGVMNAVTRFSQEVESYDRATELEELGGSVLELPQSNWREIALAGKN